MNVALNKRTTDLAELSRTPDQNSEQAAVDHVYQCVKNHLPSFLSAYSLISKEAAELGWLFDFLINNAAAQPQRYKSFYANSGLESLHGAIKLARHNAEKKSVVIVSNNAHFETLYSPLNNVKDDDLYPQTFTVDENVSLETLPLNHIRAIVFNLSDMINSSLYESLIELCQQNDILFIVDTTHASLKHVDELMISHALRPDIMVWGESITGLAIPFGAFTATDKVYAPWNSLPNCLIHSSTFGGNNIALAFVLKRILADASTNRHKYLIRAQLKTIGSSNKNIIRYFTDYVNPYSQLLFKLTKMDLLFDYGHAMSLKYTNKNKTHEILDCLGGGGCTVKGHNSMEFAQKLLDEHQCGHDYWQDLSSKFKQHTGLDDAFPAVSGASAVEIALTMALAAQKVARKPKKTIVTFDGNYAGKSLLSICATGMPSMRTPFEPLYPNVVFIDPRTPDALTQLNLELDKGDVALIWFEYMQGMDNTTISDELINVINQRKAQDGYYVGIDEVLNGLFRLGAFMSPGDAIKPDVVSFSKGISGMLVPMAACMVCQDIADKVKSSQPNLYDFYQNYYSNPVGSHVACIVLDYLFEQNIQKNVSEVGDYLKTELLKLTGPDKLLKDIKGSGFNLYLALNDDYFPLNVFGKINTIGRPLGSMMVTRICMTRGNLLPFFNRITPPLNCTRAQAEDIVTRMTHIVKIHPARLLFMAISQLALIELVTFGKKIKAVFERPNKHR